jgi:hypothetical protein
MKVKLATRDFGCTDHVIAHQASGYFCFAPAECFDRKAGKALSKLSCLGAPTQLG